MRLSARPELCVGAVAVEQDQLLLIRRGHGPAQGRGRCQVATWRAGRPWRRPWSGNCAKRPGWKGSASGCLDGSSGSATDITSLSPTSWSPSVAGIEPQAGSDAAEAAWVPLDEVAGLSLADGLAEFLYDHGVLRTFS